MQHLNSLKQHYNQYFSDVEMSKKSNADVKKKKLGLIRVMEILLGAAIIIMCAIIIGIILFM
jgi:hypothetical protein